MRTYTDVCSTDHFGSLCNLGALLESHFLDVQGAYAGVC
jgi:hypothetical protein